MSPAALTPHYDDDTKSPTPLPTQLPLLTNSILFLWSKGSRQIHAYHLTTSPSSLQLLPTFDCADLQSAVVFLPKQLVDVEKVEILQGLRLTSANKIERFAFSIPRNRVLLSCPYPQLTFVDRILPRRHLYPHCKHYFPPPHPTGVLPRKTSRNPLSQSQTTTHDPSYPPTPNLRLPCK